MIESHLHCLVMAGGQGTRFWPESTSRKPKQYLNLLGEKSLLSETLERFEGLVTPDRRFIVTVQEQEELANSNSKGSIGDGNIIFEPSGRNTGPCILLSLATLLEKGASEDDVVAIVPSDHVILNKEGFRNTLKEASEMAIREEKIVTIGILPNFPHTGFGYIQKGEHITNLGYEVVEFKEKPDFDTAKEYVASGNYYWNAGMFVGTLRVLLEEFQKHAPEMFEFYQPLRDKLGDFKALSEVYNQIPKDSIDYAIMEKSDRVLVLPASFDWNDLGSWDALETVVKEQEGNTIVSALQHYFEDAKGNIVFTPDKFVSLINVNDLIVISNENAVVVLPKSDSQKVKNVVRSLKDTKLGKELL
jgi:mannose-1-phosphate guanylyltransferase